MRYSVAADGFLSSLSPTPPTKDKDSASVASSSTEPYSTPKPSSSFSSRLRPPAAGSAIGSSFHDNGYRNGYRNGHENGIKGNTSGGAVDETNGYANSNTNGHTSGYMNNHGFGYRSSSSAGTPSTVGRLLVDESPFASSSSSSTVHVQSSSAEVRVSSAAMATAALLTPTALPADGNDRIRVACRVKPRDPRTSGARICTSVGVDQRTVAWVGDRADGASTRHFTFDYAAGEDVGQEELFEKIGRPVTNACLEGFNGTIFCYGQTGSGKTYTTFGPPEDEASPFVNGKEGNARGEGTSTEERFYQDVRSGDNRGLVPRVLEYLFDHFSEGRSRATQARSERTGGLGPSEVQVCRCSFYEIYNEHVYDLIVPEEERVSLNVREASGKGIFLEGLSEIEVNTAREACEVLTRGHASRHTASTAMNSASSRSHAIFTLVIDTATQLAVPQSEEEELMGETAGESSARGKGAMGTALPSEDGSVRVRSARFNVVDLAGSERQSRTQAGGTLLKDAASINKSLSALGRVINSLVEGAGSGHVPYRDSKLTRLLAHSLGGNSKTVLVATVSGEVVNAGETLSTLKFVQRAKMIKNRAVRNESTHGSALALRQENEGLRKLVADQELFVSQARLELQEADSHRSRLTTEVSVLREEAKRNKETALEAWEQLSERQSKLEELQQALAEKERQLSEMTTAASPRDQRRWSHPGSVDGGVAMEEKGGNTMESLSEVAARGDNVGGETPRGRSLSGTVSLRQRTRERRQRRMRRRSGGHMPPPTPTSPLRLKSGHVVARRLRFGSSSSSGTAGGGCSSERRRHSLRGLQGVTAACVRGKRMGDDVRAGNVSCANGEDEVDGDDELGEWEEEEEEELFEDGGIPDVGAQVKALKLSRVPPSDPSNPPSTEEEEENGGNWEEEENGSGDGCRGIESRRRVGATDASEPERLAESKEEGVEGAWRAVEGETGKSVGDTQKPDGTFERSTFYNDDLVATGTAVPPEAEESRPSSGVVPEVLLDAQYDLDLGQRWCPVPQPLISAVRSTSTFSSEGGGGGGLEHFCSCTLAAREVSAAADNGLSLVQESGVDRSEGRDMKLPVEKQEKEEDKRRVVAGEICEAPCLVQEGSEERSPEQSSDCSADMGAPNLSVAKGEVRTAPGAVSEDAHDAPFSIQEIPEERSSERSTDFSVSPIGKGQVEGLAPAEAETAPDDGVCLTMIRAIMKMKLPPLDDGAVAMPITPRQGGFDGADACAVTPSGTVAGCEVVEGARHRGLNRGDAMAPVTVESTRPPPLRPPTIPRRPRSGVSGLRNDASPEGLSCGDDASVIGNETPSFRGRTSGSSVDAVGGLGHRRRSSTGSSMGNTIAQSAFRSVARSTCKNDKVTAANPFSGVSGDEARGEASDTYCIFSPVKLFLSWRRKIGNSKNGGRSRRNNSSSVGRFSDGGIGRYRSGIERELLEVPAAPPSPAGFPGAGHFLPEDSDLDSDSDSDSDANEEDAGADAGDASEEARAMVDAETLVAGVVDMLRSQVCDNLATEEWIFTNISSTGRESNKRDGMAEACLRRALEINDKLYGADHPEVATDTSNLAEVLMDNGDFDNAESLAQRALEIRLRSLGPAHADVAHSLHNLSLISRAKGEYKKAHQFQAQANSIWERAFNSGSRRRISSEDTPRSQWRRDEEARLRNTFAPIEAPE